MNRQSKRRRIHFAEKSFSSNFESLGEDFIHRVSLAVKKESWRQTIMQLAWTAGPVTYFALQGGYFLGYGKTAPPGLIIYFAIYTVIAGILAILVRFMYQFTKGQETERLEKSIKQAFVKLPDLILFIRDQILRYYDMDNRRLLAAKYLLENPDATSETIRVAVFDATGDEVLADAAGQIEIFRKNGLFARIDDLYTKIIPKSEKVFNSIRAASPALEKLIKLRLQGQPPDKQIGRVRTEGFIGRVLSAGEEHDFSLMSLSDAEEIITLIYELLADRIIPVFSLQYFGSKEFVKNSENFEKARAAFRKAAYLRNSKLRRLADLLEDAKPIDIVPAASPVIITIESMYKNILKAIDELYKELKKQVKITSRGKGKVYIAPELKEEFFRLYSAIHLHHSLKKANDLLDRNFNKLKQAEIAYIDAKENSVRDFPLHLLGSKEHGPGIKIVQKQVFLSKNSKMRSVRELVKLFQLLDSKEQAKCDSGNMKCIVKTDEYKKLAIDIAMIMEKEIKLSRFEIQLAIEGSNAPFISSLGWGLTAAAKTGKAVSMVSEVQKNVQAPIHKLAYSLVNYHGMPLDQGSIDLLVQKYNVDPDVLAKMLPEQPLDEKETMEITESTDYSQIYATRKSLHMLEITNLDDKYQELIDQAAKQHIL